MAAIATHHSLFGSSEDLTTLIEHLSRLERLDHVFSESGLPRPDVIAKTRAIWKQALQDLQQETPLETVRSRLDDAFQPYEAIHEYYHEAIHSMQTIDDLSTLAFRSKSDIDSIPISPLRKSERGQKGPTYLVSYLGKHLHPKNFVFKWTDENELLCNRFYEILSRVPRLDSHEHLFHVPQSGAIHFDALTYEMTDGTRVPLNPQAKNHFQEMFSALSRNRDPDKELSHHVLLSERVIGANLFDYTHTRYQELSRTERQKLFIHLGRLALLDIVTGNLDRLAQVWWDRDSYSLTDEMETNLGNVMVTEKGTIYAIDNGIDQELATDPGAQNRYLVFLKKQLSSPDFFDRLAKNICTCMEIAIHNQVDDVKDRNVVELTREFEPFKRDIRLFGRSYLKYGIILMMHHLHAALPDPKAISELFPELYQKNPTLIQGLRDRLQTMRPL